MPCVVVVATIFLTQAVELPLAENFVYGNGDRVGEIQGAQGVPHGNADAGFLIFVQNLLGNPRGLLAEHDKHTVGVGIDLGVGSRRLGGEIVDFSLGFGVLCEKVGVVVVVGDVQLVPIVQPRPFELAVVDGKAHGTNDVECRAHGGAGARDVARVLRNLGLV